MTTHVPLPQAEPRHRLVAERRRRGWSQQYLADLIGTTQLNVSRWERAYTTPNPYFRSRLSNLFGLSLAELDLPPGTTDEFSPLPLSSGNSIAEMAPEPLFDPTIPLPSIPLVGREYELAQLKLHLLFEQQCSLSALHGLPGVGKTALVRDLVTDKDVQAHFSQGILWATLGPQPDVLAILRRWGLLLGVNENLAAQLLSVKDWLAVVQTRIAMQRVLLILDDVWNLDAALLCKVGGPHCTHLLTTRLPQVALAFAPADTLSLRELPLSESMAMLRQLAPEVVRSETERVQTIAETVGGLPLALALIGNYLRLQSHSSQPRRIHTALTRLLETRERLGLSVASTLLKSPSRALEPTISLETTIAISDQHLSSQGHAALVALSVFPPKPESFSAQAALAVSQAHPDVLDELHDTGLLEHVSPGRYSLHRTIADYARSLLHSNGPIDRLITYGLQFLTSHEHDYQALDKERAVLLAMLEAAYQQQHWVAFARGVRVLIPFLLSCGDILEQQTERVNKAAFSPRMLTQSETFNSGFLLPTGVYSQSGALQNLGANFRAMQRALML